MSCGLARFNDGPGSAVMKEEDLWGDIINFMWSKIIMFIPRTCYIDCIYRLQYSSWCKINGVLTLGMPPGVGVLTCRRQISCVSPLNLAWDSGDVLDRCFTHKFLYYCHIYKKVECSCILNWIIAKCISEIYLLITMIYKISAYHFRPCIAAREQCHVNCTKIMSGYLCLQRRLSQLSEGIEIINRILPYCQSISVLSSNCAYST